MVVVMSLISAAAAARAPRSSKAQPRGSAKRFITSPFPNGMRFLRAITGPQILRDDDVARLELPHIAAGIV
ncbi:MAG TPA: hypothetical protein VKV32_02025, partial [Stellaceae bacterium]|nr:hypothetical protein [Stellaceae bacterium]